MESNNTASRSSAIPTASASKQPKHTGRYLALALIAIALGCAAFSLDSATERWALAHQDKSVKRVAGYVSKFGDWPFLMAAAAPIAGACYMLQKRDWSRIVCTMMIASSVAGVVANTSRLTTGRTRPDAKGIPAGWYGLRHEGKWLIGQNKFNSFPSGHTATAIGFFAPLAFIAPAVGIPSLVVGFAIAGSRIYLAAHHLSDVTVASLLAFGVSWWLVKKRHWSPNP